MPIVYLPFLRPLSSFEPTEMKNKFGQCATLLNEIYLRSTMQGNMNNKNYNKN